MRGLSGWAAPDECVPSKRARPYLIEVVDPHIEIVAPLIEVVDPICALLSEAQHLCCGAGWIKG